MTPGTRVGAIYGDNGDGSVDVFGYGVYEGDFEFGDEAVGAVADLSRELGRHLNPRIRLDSGEIVWGAECWWGPEAEVRAMLDGRTVHPVSITDLRARIRAGG